MLRGLGHADHAEHAALLVQAVLIERVRAERRRGGEGRAAHGRLRIRDLASDAA